MTQDSKEKLHKEVETILHIILFAEESLRIVEFLLSKPQTVEEAWVRKDDFFYHTAIVNWRIVAVELSKLYSRSPNDIFSLRQLMINFGTDKPYHDSKITTNELTEWEETLAQEEEFIQNIIKQRNKVYAHTDKNHEEITNIVTVTKTKELFEIAKKIIEVIYSRIYKRSLLFLTSNYSPLNHLKKDFEILIEWQKNLTEYEKN